MGRFTGVDPLAESDIANNPFAYVNNNPALLLDPDGMMWVNPYEGIKGMEREAEIINNLLKELRDNDEELYNYIDNLKVGKNNILVTVWLSSNQKGDDNQIGETPVMGYGAETNYNGDMISIFAGASVGRLNQEGNAGIITTGTGRDNSLSGEGKFTIVLYGNGQNDATLANEVGDVMHKMEDNEIAKYDFEQQKSGLMTPEATWARDYSERVERQYKINKNLTSRKLNPVKGVYPFKTRKGKIYTKNGKKAPLNPNK